MLRTFCFVWLLLICILSTHAQVDTIILGQGNNTNIVVTASSQTSTNSPQNTSNQTGFLPNLNKASRFLSQATLGYNLSDIENVAGMGIEEWLDIQLNMPLEETLLQDIRNTLQFRRDSLMDQNINGSERQWHYAWWQYHMTSDDVVRQRVALALSEIIVISRNSSFGGNPFALGDYYDVLLKNALGNYKTLLEDVTKHATMGVYLTYMNNDKSDTSVNRFPDENYARELMQLFTIGLHELNNDGSYKMDSLGQPIPTYDNDDIAEFAKIFTGFSWGDRTQFNKGPYRDTSYIPEMIMFDNHHEPGPKYLLNGYEVPDRDPVDGLADVQDAINNLFDHPNVPPFICEQLIKRLVTSNPPPDYIERVANVFIDNGQGTRGDMKAVVKAILLDPFANDCNSADLIDFGMLREPFIRYVQLTKALNTSTISGRYRNDMNNVNNFVEQRPLNSPSVFNFFQPDYQPLGLVNDAGLDAPEFQITDAKTIAGYINAIYEWVMKDNIADEYDLFGGEKDTNYADEISNVDIGMELMYTDDNELHILLDRLNLILAHGSMSDNTENIIIETIKKFPNETASEQEYRARLAIYLVMTAPEYLINR